MPINGTVGETFYGVDPGAAVDDGVIDAVDGLLDILGGE